MQVEILQNKKEYIIYFRYDKPRRGDIARCQRLDKVLEHVSNKILESYGPINKQWRQL